MTATNPKTTATKTNNETTITIPVAKGNPTSLNKYQTNEPKCVLINHASQGHNNKIGHKTNAPKRAMINQVTRGRNNHVTTNHVNLDHNNLKIHKETNPIGLLKTNRIITLRKQINHDCNFSFS
jgi:purine nucleoside permease